jgi:hypothetical protein
MRWFIVLGGAVAALVLTSVALAAPPANDQLAAATGIGSLPASATVDLTEASTEVDEPAGCFGPSQTAWWSFTPAVDTVIRVDTFGSVIPGSYVNLWRSAGSGFEGLGLLDCAGYWTSLTEKLRAGTTYYFQVGSFYGVFQGDATLNIQIEPPPAFDDSTSAKVIPSVAFSESADSSYATSAPTDPDCFGRGATVWYVFVPDEDMRLEASVQEEYPDSGSRFTLSAYAGVPGSLANLDCSDDSLIVQGYRKPHIEFDARAGVPVYFMVGTSSGTDGGIFHFGVQRPLEVTSRTEKLLNVSRAGIASVVGTVTCSRPVGMTLYVTLRQVFAGRLNAHGFGQAFASCSTTPSPWSIELSSWPVSFGPGVGQTELEFPSRCDSQGCQPGALYDEGSYSRRDVFDVRLRRSK